MFLCSEQKSSILNKFLKKHQSSCPDGNFTDLTINRSVKVKKWFNSAIEGVITLFYFLLF